MASLIFAVIPGLSFSALSIDPQSVDSVLLLDGDPINDVAPIRASVVSVVSDHLF